MGVIHTSTYALVRQAGKLTSNITRIAGRAGWQVGTFASTHSIGDPIANGRDFVETGR